MTVVVVKSLVSSRYKSPITLTPLLYKGKRYLEGDLEENPGTLRGGQERGKTSFSQIFLEFLPHSYNAAYNLIILDDFFHS